MRARHCGRHTRGAPDRLRAPPRAPQPASVLPPRPELSGAFSETVVGAVFQDSAASQRAAPVRCGRSSKQSKNSRLPINGSLSSFHDSHPLRAPRRALSPALDMQFGPKSGPPPVANARRRGAPAGRRRKPEIPRSEHQKHLDELSACRAPERRFFRLSQRPRRARGRRRARARDSLLRVFRPSSDFTRPSPPAERERQPRKPSATRSTWRASAAPWSSSSSSARRSPMPSANRRRGARWAPTPARARATPSSPRTTTSSWTGPTCPG